MRFFKVIINISMKFYTDLQKCIHQSNACHSVSKDLLSSLTSNCAYLNFDTIKTIFVEDVAKLEDISNEIQFR